MNCCRERKEWHSLTQAQRCLFIDTLIIASTQQPYKNCYHNLINLHGVYFHRGLHGGPKTFFFPFHRWFLLQVENLLRRINCSVTIPYWDWSAEADRWKDSVVWDSKCGFGGDGNSSQVFHISGPFGNLRWKPPGIEAITRLFSDKDLPSIQQVCEIQEIGADEYERWHNKTEKNLHNTFHCRIGGDDISGTMCSDMAANDPVFFLHHGFIDHLWSDWQKKGREYLEHEAFSRNTAIMPISNHTSPSQVYNLLKQPGCVKVCAQASTCPHRMRGKFNRT